MILDNDSYISWSTAGSTVATVKGVAKELGVDYQTLDGKVIFDQAQDNPIYQKYVDRYYSVLAMGYIIFNMSMILKKLLLVEQLVYDLI